MDFGQPDARASGVRDLSSHIARTCLYDGPLPGLALLGFGGAKSAIEPSEIDSETAAIFAFGEAPDRDWTVGDLFRYIRPDVLESEGGRPVWKEVGRRVRQAAADSQIALWGVPCGEDGLVLGSFEETPTHRPIAPDQWHRAKFSYQFFSPDSVYDRHVTIYQGALTEHFCDLRVNSASAKKVFKFGGPDPNTGRWENGSFVYHQPRLVWSAELTYEQRTLDGDAFHIMDIEPRATFRYAIETHPRAHAWHLALGQDRETAFRFPSGNESDEATLDEAGYVRFFANGCATPKILNTRIFVHSWRKP